MSEKMKSKNYSSEEKASAIARYLEGGESVLSISADTGISRSSLYAWIKEERNTADTVEFSLKNFRIMVNKISRLEGIIEILQKVNCTVSSPLEEKLPAMEELYNQYSVHMLCDALQVPRGTFYNYIFRNKRDNTWYAKRREELRIRIQEIYDESNQIFGAGKIAAVMKEEGWQVSQEMVRKLMREMGLLSIRQDAKKVYEKERLSFKNHLNQQFDVTKPNEVWVSDVTYFRCKDIKYYICAIIDLYARKVVGYRVGKKNSTQLVKSTFKQAYESRKPGSGLTFHTDRGSNYRSYAMCSYLRELGVVQSFSKAGVPYDNSVMESFFSSLKREELYRTKYRSETEFRAAVDKYMVFYNERRPHTKNGYKTPMKLEAIYFGEESKPEIVS